MEDCLNGISIALLIQSLDRINGFHGLKASDGWHRGF